MIEKKIGFAFVIELVRRFSVIFSLSVIAITGAGMLIKFNGKDMSETSIFFALNSGLQYGVILQTAGFSFILAFISVLLFSDLIQTKMRFFFRGFLLLLATLATTSIFAVIFNWFPQKNIKGWIGFALCTIFCFTVCFVLTYLKLKLEGKKYAKLLVDYKMRRNKV